VGESPLDEGVRSAKAGVRGRLHTLGNDRAGADEAEVNRVGVGVEYMTRSSTDRSPTTYYVREFDDAE